VPGPLKLRPEPPPPLGEGLGARDVPEEAGHDDVTDDLGEGSKLQHRRQVADQRRLNRTAASTH